MFLIDFAVVTKKDKTYRIATFFDPNGRVKVVTKFLRDGIAVPTEKVVPFDRLKGVEQVDVQTDLSGNVTSIV